MRDPEFQAVPELVKAMEQLDEEKFAKLMAYLNNPVNQRVRTNNHVERTNRMVRFFEKVRYKWRRRKTLVRFLVLKLDEIWSRWSPPRIDARPRRKGSGDPIACLLTGYDRLGGEASRWSWPRSVEKTATLCHFGAPLAWLSCGRAGSATSFRIGRSDEWTSRPVRPKPKWHEAPTKNCHFCATFLYTIAT